MSIWVDVARLSAGVNVLLLLGLLALWGRSHRQFRSKHTLGLTLFAAFLLAENALALYMYLVDPMLSGWFSTDVPVVAWRLMMLLHVLETVGIGFLAWTSMD
jgi:hypothetical protein